MNLKLSLVALLAVSLFLVQAELSPARAQPANSIDGVWVVESAVREGQEETEPVGDQVQFARGKMTIKSANGEKNPPPLTYTLIETVDPWTIDVKFPAPGKPLTVQGLAAIEDGKLKLCLSEPQAERPKDLTGAGEGEILLVLMRPTK